MAITIYTLFDPRNPEVFHYVGQTDNVKRRLYRHIKTPRSRMIPWLESLKADNVLPQMKIICIVEIDEADRTENAIRLLYKRDGHPLKCRNGTPRVGIIKAAHAAGPQNNKRLKGTKCRNGFAEHTPEQRKIKAMKIANARKLNETSGTSNSKPVTYNGIDYYSIAEMSRTLNITRSDAYQLLGLPVATPQVKTSPASQ